MPRYPSTQTPHQTYPVIVSSAEPTKDNRGWEQRDGAGNKIRTGAVCPKIDVFRQQSRKLKHPILVPNQLQCGEAAFQVKVDPSKKHNLKLYTYWTQL